AHRAVARRADHHQPHELHPHRRRSAHAGQRHPRRGHRLLDRAAHHRRDAAQGPLPGPDARRRRRRPAGRDPGADQSAAADVQAAGFPLPDQRRLLRGARLQPERYLRRAHLRPGSVVALLILAAMAKGLLAVLFLAGSACFGSDVTTMFPPGLEPLEPSTAGLPPQPDTVAIVTGENSMFTFGHARGRVSAAPGAVWAALKEPAVVASRRQTDSWSYTLDESPLYEYEFTIHYEVDEILTVDWDEDWRYGTIQGTPESPQLAIIRWQKVFG